MRVLLILLLLVSQASASGVVIGSGASCTTQTDQSSGTGLSSTAMMRFANQDWWGGQFTAADTGTYTICKAVLRLSATLSPTMNLTVCIYSNDGAETDPDTQVGTCSDPVSASTIGAAEGDVTFSNISASVTNGTAYWVVIKGDAVSGTDYPNWFHYTDAGKMVVDDDGSGTWTQSGTTKQPKFTLYK